MRPKAIIPESLRQAAEQLKMSPAILSGDHLYLTGATGGNADATMPVDPEVQFRNCFEKIGVILQEADLTFASVVEMTTFHVGLRDHFERFDAIRLEYFQPPYPAWTAVEVAGLRRPGAVVEIRIVANTGPSSSTS